MKKTFSPMLAIDASDYLDKIKYPKYASYKLDGIRCIFHPQLGMISRALKPIPNKQLNDKFKNIIELSKRFYRIFDGELYSHNLSFQEISRAVMTQDFDDLKTIKKLKKELNTDNIKKYTDCLIDQIEFHCFEAPHETIQEQFCYKLEIINKLQQYRYVIPQKQIVVNSSNEVKELFNKALDEGFEGLILRSPESTYKYGRSTLKEEYMLKVKPFETFDAIILDVIQATEVNPEAEKKINELGRSVTSRKKDDRMLIEKASAFLVDYNGVQQKVSIAMTDTEKEEVWRNKEQYIGKWICFKGMLIGSKEAVRHPVFSHMRPDLDE